METYLADNDTDKNAYEQVFIRLGLVPGRDAVQGCQGSAPQTTYLCWIDIVNQEMEQRPWHQNHRNKYQTTIATTQQSTFVPMCEHYHVFCRADEHFPPQLPNFLQLY